MASKHDRSGSSDAIQCVGGKSFNCSHHLHNRAEKRLCWRCEGFLGCAKCTDKLADIVCLKCQNWGSKEALHKHGRMVKDKETMREAWKIVRMAENGQINANDADSLYQQLFATLSSV